MDQNDASQPAPLQPARVLIVDEDPDITDVFERLLSLCGYETRAARDAAGAIATAQEFRPHVILIDVPESGVAGHETTRQLRQADLGDGRVTLVAMSAHTSEADQQLAREAGADHFLAKPFDFDALRQIVASVAT